MKQGKQSNKGRKNNKQISKKHYVYSALILLGGILLIWYIFAWIDVKKEEKLMNSYLISSNTISSSIKDFDALSQILTETSSSYFIYLGFIKDENVYNLEKSLKKVIDDYNLNDNFYYFDITDIKNNKNYLDELQNKLKVDSLNATPAIIYVHNGELIESNILDGKDDKMLTANDLKTLLKKYSYNQIG